MTTIGAGEFKAKCLGIIDEVNRTGEPVTITKRGKPVARIVPVERPRAIDPVGSMKGTFEIVGDIISPIDVEWDVMK